MEMTLSFKVYPYKQGSKSAKALADVLNGKVLKLVGSKYHPKRGDVIINWGAGRVPDFGPATTLNSNVVAAQCKLTTLQILFENEVRVPPFAAGREGLDLQLDDEEIAFPVVCRTKLRGHSGEGIVIANNEDGLVDAPLYTKYIKKKDEYRVHVFRGNPFFIQRKARKLDVEEPNWQIRNLAGGFVFVEIDAENVPDDVLTQAENAVEALGLDFGGVDVMWNEREQKAYVLEVNTACGLEERTAEKYREEFLHLI